jgi:hypothetical protein
LEENKGVNMGEYNGKINVSKDSMLFVVNSVFNQGIKESTTKENILKLMPAIYENADDEEIIKMLPYRTYKDLERLIDYIKTSDDIKSFFYKREHPDIRFLEEAMIIVMRAKHLEYNYSFNPGVIEKLTRLFSDENKKIAERYGNIENLTVGMLYEYGIVDFDFLRKQLCKYMNEIITEEELRDIFFTRMNLNRFVNDYNIKWTNTNEVQYFVTYLDEEYSPIDIGEIAEEQKARKMKYKQFSKQELLKREEYLYDERAKKLYKFLKSKNDNIYEWTFKRLLKNNELGIDILGDLSNMCMFADDIELKKFMDLFTDWYNNSPQYMLGGYSPIEFRKTFK